MDGRVNWVTIAHVGILNHGTPQYLSFGVHKSHHSNKGILANGTFSVNIPGPDLLAETDYVGIVSGAKTDKSAVFETFTGELDHAPMIKGCPVCMECRLKDTLDFETHDIFVGEVAATWADPAVLDDDGRVDIARARPLLFDMQSVAYWGLGERLGRCWSVGKALKKQ